MASRNYQTIRLFDELNNYEKTIETTLKDSEKEHKALDIIVNKQVEMGWLLFCFKNHDVDTYNSCQDKYQLTLEEYCFLKGHYNVYYKNGK